MANPPSGEHHNLGNVIWCQGIHPLVHGVGLGLVAVEADDGEFLTATLATRIPFSSKVSFLGR